MLERVGGKGSNKGSGQGFCFNFSIPIACTTLSFNSSVIFFLYSKFQQGIY